MLACHCAVEITNGIGQACNELGAAIGEIGGTAKQHP